MMKKLIFTLVFALIGVNGFAQEPAGKADYDKVIKGWDNNSMGTDKGFKLLTKSCELGYIPACKRLLITSSGNKKQIVERCAESGDLECMYHYVWYYYSNKNSLQELNPQAQKYLFKACEAGYEPALLFLSDLYEKEGSFDKAIPLYQTLADKGNKKAVYHLAILKKDAKTAFEAAAEAEDKWAKNLYDSADKSNDPQFIFETAKIFQQNKDDSAGFLYADACKLGHGEACYRRGLDYLSDYRDHENGMKWFENAKQYGYNVPEKDFLKMKNPPSEEDKDKVNAKLQAQIEESERYAKNHPNGEDEEVEERKPLTDPSKKVNKSLSQAEMDQIIKNNSPSKSEQDEAIRHQRELDKQAADLMKIKTGSKSGF